MLALMEQLIKESKQGEINLDKEEFLKAMNFLLTNTCIPEKHTILLRFVKELSPEQMPNMENSQMKKSTQKWYDKNY